MLQRQFFKFLTGVAGTMVIGLAGAATTSHVTVAPTLPFSDPGYSANGSITTTVANTPDCTSGTFTVNASPVAASGPGGSSPPSTSTVTYIGFPAGNFFLFDNAGYGQYQITTTTTACAVGTPPAQIVDLVNVAGIPTVSNVLPSTGGVAGGTSVVITGTSFTGATAVTFGGTPATSFVVDSDSQITAVTPPGAIGAVLVAVTVPGGTVATGTFAYVQPSAIPTLSEWAMVLMASIMALFGMSRIRRR